ncbi:MAG: hypothetical protein ACLRZH_02335 [Ruthenibacterium lactatiformans]
MLTEQTEDGMGAVAYARVAADGTAVPVQPEGLSAQGGLVAADAQVLPGGRLLLTSFGGDFAAVQNEVRGRRRRAGGIFRHAGQPPERRTTQKMRTARSSPGTIWAYSARRIPPQRLYTIWPPEKAV